MAAIIVDSYKVNAHFLGKAKIVAIAAQKVDGIFNKGGGKRGLCIVENFAKNYRNVAILY